MPKRWIAVPRSGAGPIVPKAECGHRCDRRRRSGTKRATKWMLCPPLNTTPVGHERLSAGPGR